MQCGLRDRWLVWVFLTTTVVVLVGCRRDSEPLTDAGNWVETPVERGPQQELRGPVAGQKWTSPTTEMEFVWIDALKLWVGKYEVTNGEYRKKKPRHDSGSGVNHSFNGDRQPVVHVNFDDAKAYAEWMTQQDRAALGGTRYRLPSEQEFMVYAQCGDGREYPWGNRWPPRSGQAGNYHGQEGAGTWTKIASYNDGFPVTAPVDRLWANSWGLYGVGGNVWEICARDSSGGSFGARRGASWFDDSQGILRCTYRSGVGGSRRLDSYGFRLVVDGSTTFGTSSSRSTHSIHQLLRNVEEMIIPIAIAVVWYTMGIINIVLDIRQRIVLSKTKVVFEVLGYILYFILGLVLAQLFIPIS